MHFNTRVSHIFILLLQTMQGVECNGPEKCAEVVCKYFPEGREHVVVFDVGTGTGLAAEEVCYIYIILVKIYMKLIL